MPTSIANVMELVVFMAAHPHGCVQYRVSEAGTPVVDHLHCALDYMRNSAFADKVTRIVGFTDAGDANEHSGVNVYGGCTECHRPLYPED